MQDAPRLLRIPKSECPDTWIRLPRHKWPKSWSSIEDPVVLLERNLYGTIRASFIWSLNGRKIPNWECVIVSSETRLFLSVYVDDIKMAGTKWMKKRGY